MPLLRIDLKKVEERVCANSLLEKILKRRPEALKKWDGWDYKIWGPVSLDDVPSVFVKLTNKSGSFVVVELPLQ